MVTKLGAARLAARSGAHTLIASGEEPKILTRILDGENLGTWLQAEVSVMTARKRWIAGQLRAKGDIVIDNGAVHALRQRGVSLLAVGILVFEVIFDAVMWCGVWIKTTRLLPRA